MKENKNKDVNFEELKELVTPLYKWLQDNYDPYTSIVISCGLFRIINQECGMTLPIRD